METQMYVTLDTLAGGAVSELFQEELRKVLENIADINTDPTKAREISIKVRLSADIKRETANTEIAVQSRLAPVQRVETRLFLGKHQGEHVAVENDPRQGKLFDDRGPAVAPPVTSSNQSPSVPQAPELRAVNGGKSNG